MVKCWNKHMGRYAPYIRPKNYFLFTRVSTRLVFLDFDLKGSVCVMKTLWYVKKLLLRPCSKCTENIQKELAIRNWKKKLESSEHSHWSFNLSQEEQFVNVCAFSVFLPRSLVEFLYTSVAKKEPFAKMLSSAILRYILYCAWKEKP